MRSIYLVSAPDKPGLVGRIGGFFFERDINIVDASNHSDADRFYMRVVTERPAEEKDFHALCEALGGEGSVGYSDHKAKVALLVTRDPSCLYDLVLRQRAGELQCEFPLIISNHQHLRGVADSFGIPYVHLPVTPETKPQQEAQILEHCKGVELVVLARYMQVLSESFLQKAPPVINIHHGFLPAFQGAKPYHQAHERGVKLIGATAHYATKDLDQGPIIEQDVARVTHREDAEALVRIGRDVERVVLSRAVRAHLERRVIVSGRRTFIL